MLLSQTGEGPSCPQQLATSCRPEKDFHAAERVAAALRKEANRASSLEDFRDSLTADRIEKLLAAAEPTAPPPRVKKTNAYVVFAREQWGKMRSRRHGSLTLQDMSPVIGARWGALPRAERAKYKRLAKEENARRQRSALAQPTIALRPDVKPPPPAPRPGPESILLITLKGEVESAREYRVRGKTPFRRLFALVEEEEGIGEGGVAFRLLDGTWVHGDETPSQFDNSWEVSPSDRYDFHLKLWAESAEDSHRVPETQMVGYEPSPEY